MRDECGWARGSCSSALLNVGTIVLLASSARGAQQISRVRTQRVREAGGMMARYDSLPRHAAAMELSVARAQLLSVGREAPRGLCCPG